MSRIGKQPITLPKGVAIDVKDGTVAVKGPKGELSRKRPPLVDIKVEGSEVVCSRQNNSRTGRAMHGLARALLQNMVTGVSEGFTRRLDINGVGYRAEAKDKLLSLTLGYSHPIEVLLPAGISAKVDKGAVILSGADNEQLGQLCAVIRDQRPPEPYKGKGVKYSDERILRKVGKAGAAAK